MPVRKIRWLVGIVAVALVPSVSAPAAGADPPARQDVTFTGAVTDNGEACGFPVAWEFVGDAAVTRFFDDGTLVRVQVQIRESGTVTNLATGEVVELPRTAFVQRTLFVDGTAFIIEVNGLSVRVTGPDDFLLDVGRFVIRLNPNDLLQSSGQHPIREINPFSVSDPALLAAFCDLLA